MVALFYIFSCQEHIQLLKTGLLLMLYPQHLDRNTLFLQLAVVLVDTSILLALLGFSCTHVMTA